MTEPWETYAGAPEDLIRRWEKRRAPLGLGEGEHLPDPACDLDVIARETVIAPPLEEGASDHARKLHELAPEFVGQSALLLLHAILVAHLRKRSWPDAAPILFRRLWSEQAAFLLGALSTRWLISAVVTFGTHGATEAERSLGRTGDVLLSTMKLYENERRFGGLAPAEPHGLGRKAAADLPMGMTPFSLATGGLDVNLLAPIWAAAREVPVAGPPMLALLRRLNADPGTVFARLKHMREQKAARAQNRRRREPGPERPRAPRPRET